MIGGLVSVLALSSAAAQPAPASSQPESQATNAERVIEINPLAATPGRTTEVLTGGHFDFEISEEESELTVGYTFATRSQRVVGAAGQALSLAQETFNIELSVPVGGTDNLFDRDTLDGLVDGIEMTASYTWFGTRSEDPFTEDNRAFAAIIERAYQNCIAGREGPRLSAAECEARRDMPRRQFALEYSGLSPAQINRTLLNPGVAGGIEGSVGLNRFGFRTAGTLAENEVTEPAFSVGAFVSLYPSDGVSMWTLSAGYENTFEARDAEIICRTVITLPNDDCVSAPPGAPRHVERLPIELEYRRVSAPIRGFGRFAIAPRFAVDALSGEIEAELPIYLIPQGTSAILPGVSVSYGSKDDEVVFGLFLRQRFSFK